MSASAEAPPPDGLYLLGTGDRPIRPVDISLFRAILYGQDNGNERFTLSLHSRTPFPTEEKDSSLGLILAGQPIRIKSWGSSGNDDFHLSPTLSSPETVEAAIKLYRPEILKRFHPGHQILAKFAPERPEYSLGDAITVRLTLTNVGEKPFTFVQGGRNRGARDNQFDFTARFQGKTVPDAGDPMHMGGTGGFITLKPGEKREIEVNLKQWFNFDQPGFYQVRGSYVLELRVDNRFVWEEFVGGEFFIRIKD